jgi:hypothetical protein
VLLERGPARKAVGSRQHSLRVGQSEIRWNGAPFETLDFGDGCLFAGSIRLEQFLGLLAELGKTRLVLESARGRRLRRHDVLLSTAIGRMARCPRHEPKEGALTINHNEEVRWAQPFPRTQQRPARLVKYTKPGPRFNRKNGVKPARLEALGLRVVGVGIMWRMRFRREQSAHQVLFAGGPARAGLGPRSGRRVRDAQLRPYDPDGVFASADLPGHDGICSLLSSCSCCGVHRGP